MFYSDRTTFIVTFPNLNYGMDLDMQGVTEKVTEGAREVLELLKEKTLSGDAVRTVVDWMISEHYILKTKGKYPVLHSTYEGLHYSESITEAKLKKLKKQLKGNKMPFDVTAFGIKHGCKRSIKSLLWL